MPKVSVIIPVYNTKDFLPECIDSLRNQSLNDLEIICVDDGSKDGSWEILKKYAEEDKRVKVLKNKRKGVGAARNTGYEVARGEYVGFVDSDDYVDVSMYEKLYDKAKTGNCDVAIGGVNLLFMDSGRQENFRPQELYDKYSAYCFFNAKKYPEIIQNIGIWDRIYKREFLIRNQILNVEDISFEDHLYTIKTTVLADRICVVNEPFYKYRKNVGSSLTDKEKKVDKYKLDIFENKRRGKEFLKSELVYPLFRQPFLFHQFNEAIYHMKYAVKFSTFKYLFNTLKEMTDTEDYQYLDSISINRINLLSRYLQRGDLFGCYLAFGRH